MFTNLIESNSHKREFKRRSSFFAATVAAYALVLTAAGIVGIVTYDARVDAQNLDLLLQSWIPPVKPPQEPEGPRPARKTPSTKISERPTRPKLYESPSNPTKPPDTVSVAANPIPPAPANAIEAPYVSDLAATSSASTCDTCTGTDPRASAVVEKPQPTPEPTPVKAPAIQRVSMGVLIAKIISLPKPNYPVIAKQARATGPVNVQILIDESGNVISAHAVNGHPMLIHAAEDAARRARFTPTLLSNQPVKVQGVIVYNFVLQ
jgi:periplasmic protein TonB